MFAFTAHGIQVKNTKSNHFLLNSLSVNYPHSCRILVPYTEPRLQPTVRQQGEKVGLGLIFFNAVV